MALSVGYFVFTYTKGYMTMYTRNKGGVVVWINLVVIGIFWESFFSDYSFRNGYMVAQMLLLLHSVCLAMGLVWSTSMWVITVSMGSYLVGVYSNNNIKTPQDLESDYIVIYIAIGKLKSTVYIAYILGVQI